MQHRECRGLDLSGIDSHFTEALSLTYTFQTSSKIALAAEKGEFGEEEVVFGLGLSQEELLWIAREIRSWLISVNGNARNS